MTSFLKTDFEVKISITQVVKLLLAFTNDCTNVLLNTVELGNNWICQLQTEKIFEKTFLLPFSNLLTGFNNKFRNNKS